MISIKPTLVVAALTSIEDDIDEHVKKISKELVLLIKSNKLSKKQNFYVRYLYCKLDSIIYGDSSKIGRLKKVFDLILKSTDEPDDFKQFKDKLIKILDYKKLRSGKNRETSILLKFFNEIGIKSCVYCNAQLSVVIEKKGGKLSSNFQVDHYIDKASYPCFSVSFFNLYPVCASCNNKKRNKEIGFQLYSENQQDLEKSPFEFEINRASLAKFRLSRNYNDLIVKFDDKNSGLNAQMNVQEIYDTQKDLAEEIIVKAEIYNKSYGTSLKKSFAKLYGNNGIKNLDFNRFIVGNYTDPKDIHKRPMSKFTQDIARQLKLIP